METFPEDPFQTVKTRVVGGETGGRGLGDGDHGIAVCL